MKAQETINKNNISEPTEFDIVCRAKNKDKDAIEWIWKKYRSLMVGMIGDYWWYHRLTEGEMESEAFVSMLRKLEVFRPEKIGKTVEEWRFKYMLISAAWHCRNRLKTKAIRDYTYEGDSYDEDKEMREPGRFSEYIRECPIPRDILDLNFERFQEYNPENIIMRETEESLENKAKCFMDMITPFQKTALELRRAGMTIQQVADQMGCCFTKVRKQIVKARKLAYSVFEMQES
jgi:RNA polymerase sigma factor (sigma-70 family)